MGNTWKPNLDKEKIIAGVRTYYLSTGKIPTKASGIIPDLMGDNDLSFSALYHAIYRGRRGTDSWNIRIGSGSWISFLESVLGVDLSVKKHHSLACRVARRRARENSMAGVTR